MEEQRFDLQIAQIVRSTSAEGPGRRFAIWLQGCPLRCPQCCNPEMLPFAGGEQVDAGELIEQIRAAQDSDQIEGVTLLGGEPFGQAAAAAELAERIRRLDLSVMVFTGYTLPQLQALADAEVSRLLRWTDLLVDGPYDCNRPDTVRRWIGSTNQQIHFLTNRYAPDDPCWTEPDTLEIRFDGREITVNGFPTVAAELAWNHGRHGG